nr:MAG TPA: hypothetical protein [Caudoviricetes sp.]
MTAADMEKKIINLLGYTDGSGNIAPNAHLRQRALTAINVVYADLFYALGRTEFSPVTVPEDKINLPERILHDVMPYGAAAFLAQSENDGDQQQYYIMLYNQKRAALTRNESVEDSMPTPE